MDRIIPHDHNQPVGDILEKMPSQVSFQEAASVFQQMSDGSRLRIFCLLCHCEECVCDIAAALDMTSAAVSHHLKTLKMYSLITNRRIGKEMHYTLADNETARLLHRLTEDYFQIACPREGWSRADDQ